MYKRQLLSDKFDPSQIYASPGNWNNFYGLCFSLLELKKHHKFGIFEIGTNNFGEINELSSILQPEVGVITSIGKAHLEKLINLEKPKKEFISSKIVTDSRKISKGDCFLALKGPNFNGHDFIDEALDRGASFVISEKNYPQDEKILGVNSTNECLSFLAKYQREKFEGKVVGITGSNGKTSTKLLLSSLLFDKFDPSQIYLSLIHI